MTVVRREMRFLGLPDQATEQKTEDAPSRVRRFVASNEAVDSYNTIIKADGWDLARFNQNPVILFGHNGRALPIGKGRAWVEGKELLLDVDFFTAETNPVADQVMRVLDTGVMGASVGFDPLEWEYNESRETGDEWMDMWNPPLDYTKARLLEVSVVTIPANPEALPVGRAAVQERMLKRLEARRGPTVEDVTKMITRVVREVRNEQHAADLRRQGKTTRS